MTARTRKRRTAARVLAYSVAGMLAWWLGMWAIGARTDLPWWRSLIGAVAFGSAILFWIEGSACWKRINEARRRTAAME